MRTTNRQKKIRLLGILILLGSSMNTAAANFQIGDTSVHLGATAQIRLDVPAGPHYPETYIPGSVINGVNAGPVLLVVAGVHGYEFAPILAAQEFAADVDARQLSGTLLIVNLAHVPAFEARTPYVNPNDRQNLNRAFPGAADGSQTERIAHVLSHQLISRADAVIDVHSGDGGEWLEAFVGVYGGKLSAKFETALAIGRAFHFPNIVRYSMDTQAQVDRGRSLNRQAVAQGVPTILVEIGQNGGRDPAHVRANADGLYPVLGVLGMTAASNEAPSNPPRYFDGTSSVPVANTGIWTPTQQGAREITKGEVLGVIWNYWGEVIEEVIAPVDGFALYGLAGPPVQSGESVLTIARPVESLEPQS